MRAEARGLSGMLIASTPTDFRNRAPSISLRISVPLGGTISTMVTKFAAAIFAPSFERLRQGHDWSRSRRGLGLRTRTGVIWSGLHRRARPISWLGYVQGWFRNSRRPGARPPQRTCARSSPCIPASINRCSDPRPSAECRHSAGRLDGSVVAARTRSMASSMATGPTLQLQPMTSAPQLSTLVRRFRA